MSAPAAREAIAAAMNATGLVKVSPTYRQSVKAGDGLVRFSSLGPTSNRFGHMVTWQVWLALPQDVKAAETWLETHLTALVAAFEIECALLSVTPAELIFGANTVNGVIFEGARAAD